MAPNGKVMLWITQEGRGVREQLPLPETTRTHLPKITPAAALKAEVRRFTASGANDLDRARLDAAVTRFLGAA